MIEVSFEQFAAMYCERQVCTPLELQERLRKQRERYQPIGWILLQCEMMDSSRLGEYSILPFGPNNTLQAVPEGPISPRGLASDMSTVVAVLPMAELP